jgi:hypothetical protein
VLYHWATCRFRPLAAAPPVDANWSARAWV